MNSTVDLEASNLSKGLIIRMVPETVIDVHHGQPGVWPEVALVDPCSQGIMEYLDSIVCSAAARVRVIGDDSGEPGEAVRLKDIGICLIK